MMTMSYDTTQNDQNMPLEFVDTQLASELSYTEEVTYKNINPSDLKLIVITSCNCNLQCNININVVFKCLAAGDDDDLVKTVELENSSKGEPRTIKNVRRNKKNPSKDKKKKHFINQITIVLHHQDSKINVKLFGNGKMVITGAKSTSTLKEALGLLVEKIRSLSLETKINDFEERCVDGYPLLEYFKSPTDLVKFLEKNHLTILDLVNRMNLDFPLDWYKILINSEKNKILEKECELETFVSTELFKTFNNELPIILYKLIQTVKLVKNYSYSTLSPFIVEDAIKYYSGQTINLVTSYEPIPSPEALIVTVNNYNALFNTNIKFDRERFHQVLTNQCGILVNYRPSSYQGLKVTHFLNYEGEKEGVTFFVFQEGAIMITGNKKWEVIEQSYREMCKIIDTYYDQIVNNDSKVTVKRTEPFKIEKEINGEPCVFLNKKLVISSHPRNRYLLKTLDLMSFFGETSQTSGVSLLSSASLAI